VHFARNLLQRIPIGAAFSAGVAQQGMVTAALSSLFAQENNGEIRSRWDDLAVTLNDRFH
jgi:hypothetical protein